MKLYLAARRTFIICAVLLAAYWIALCIGTHLPPHHPIMNFVMPVWDKLLHFSGFGGLAFLIALAWAVQRQNRRSEPETDHSINARLKRFFSQKIPLINYVLIWTLVVAYGSVDEPSQTDFERSCDIFDLLADTIGATFGLVCFALIMWLGRWYFQPEHRAPEM